MPADLLTTDGKPGVKATYLKQDIVTDEMRREPERRSAGHAHRAGHRSSRRSPCRPKRPQSAAGGALGDDAHAEGDRRLQPGRRDRRLLSLVRSMASG